MGKKIIKKRKNIKTFDDSEDEGREMFDSNMNDEIDDFHDARNKILLDNTAYESSDDSEVLGIGNGDFADSDDENDDSEAEFSSNVDDDDEEEIYEEKLLRDLEARLPLADDVATKKTKKESESWGKRVKNYYDGEEEEDNENEELEALKIQKRARKFVREDDYVTSVPVTLANVSSSIETTAEISAASVETATPELLPLLKSLKEKLTQLQAIEENPKDRKTQLRKQLLTEYTTLLFFYLSLYPGRNSEYYGSGLNEIVNHPCLKVLVKLKELEDELSDSPKSASKPKKNADLDLYNSLKSVSKKRKARSPSPPTAEEEHDDLSQSDDESIQDLPSKRKASYAILANKGLTPKRKKETRNPRVKHRKKFEKKVKRLSSFRPVFKGNSGGAYQGEGSGINTRLVRVAIFGSEIEVWKKFDMKEKLFRLIRDGDFDKLEKFARSLHNRSPKKFLILLNTAREGHEEETYLTPLQVACKEGNLKLVQLFCELGADVNIDVDYDNRNFSSWESIQNFRSPASLACIYGHFDVLVYLVESRGAIVEFSNDSDTPRTAGRRGAIRLNVDTVDSNCSTRLVDNPELFSKSLYYVSPRFYSYSLMFPTVYFRHTAILFYLISCGCNVNIPRDEDGSETAISLAVQRNFFDMVQQLIENGAFLVVDDRNLPVYELRIAAAHGNFDVIRYFFENRNEINFDENHRLSMFFDGYCKVVEAAILSDREDIAEFLIEKVPEFPRDSSLLGTAVRYSSTTCLKRILKHESVRMDGYLLCCVLSIVQNLSMERFVENLKVLVEFGELIEIQERKFHATHYAVLWSLPVLELFVPEDITSIVNWEDLLCMAAATTNPTEGVEVMNFLLEHESIRSTVNGVCGYTALIHAVKANNIDIVKLLISNGVNVYLGYESYLALTFSVQSSNEKLGYEISKILIDAGSVITNEHVDLAIRSGNVEILKLLISLRPVRRNLMMRIEKLLTLPHLPPEKNFSEMCEFLVEHLHVNVKLRDTQGKTLLHRAAVVESSTKALTLLIARGADLKERDNAGYCVFGFAAKKNALRAISYLFDYDQSLANIIVPGESKLPIEILSPGSLLFRHMPDYEELVVGFVKLVRATKNKRAVWNSLNRIIMERAELMKEWIEYGDIDMDKVKDTVHDQRSLGLIEDLARELIYKKVDEIGNLADTDYVSEWTKKVIRSCSEALIVFVVRNWVINNKKLPTEIIYQILSHSEINWRYEKISKQEQ